MRASVSLVHNVLSYFSGRVAILLAGLISLPITTRLLSQDDYGVMSLVFLTITVVSSLAAMGFPQSTTRFFSEYSDTSTPTLRTFCTTMTKGALASGLLAMVAVLLIALWLESTPSYSGMASHLKYAVVLLPIRLVSSVFLQIFRGNQQTFAYNLFSISNRYLTIAAIVALLLYVYGDVAAVFVGTIAIELAVLLVAAVYLVRKRFIGWIGSDYTLVSRAIRFGAPLVVADLMVSLVASADRFAIQFFLDSSSVAIYSVGYDIADYVATMFANPLQLALLPIVYKLWSNQGQEVTQEFLNKSISLSTAIIVPMIAGFAVVGPDVVTTLASEKYAESGQLIRLIAPGVILGSVNFLFFIGLLLHEKTRVITVLNGSAVVLNLLLNILLIPSFGIKGAVYATIATYVTLNIVTFITSNRYLSIRIELPILAKVVIASICMTVVITWIPDVSEYRIANALTRTAVGAIVYSGLLICLDSMIRDTVRTQLHRIRGFLG